MSVFKHVAGVGIGSALGAAAFAGAAHLNLFQVRHVCGNARNAAILGAVLAGVSTVGGAGESLYNVTLGQLESKPSFASKINAEREKKANASISM